MLKPSIAELRRQPAEWHRRGLLHPSEIEALLLSRLLENVPADPTYSDFFHAGSRR